MCVLECGLQGLTTGGSGAQAVTGSQPHCHPPNFWLCSQGREEWGNTTCAGSEVGREVSGRPESPPRFSGEPGTVLSEPRRASIFCQCPAGISQALSLGSCAFRTACGPPFPGAPPSLTLPPTPPCPQVPPTRLAAQPGPVRAPRGCTSAPALCPVLTRGLRPLPCPQVRRTQ